VVDWHALTTSYEDPAEIRKHTKDMLLDWLSVGLDPEKSTIMIQSKVKQHAELHLLLSMLMPLSWLERVPTYKDQIQQLSKEGKTITTYGFLGYPLLMTADILVYKAEVVPVGEDQLVHLELSREVARRFNHLYSSDLFPEPEALLAKIPMVPGIDKRKMSKSYNNYIPINTNRKDVEEKVRHMITDPARIRKDDPGNPDICVVYSYHKIYNQPEQAEIAENCRKARLAVCNARKILLKN
jgi:tryptophanyl-tRNA synthetase